MNMSGTIRMPETVYYGISSLENLENEIVNLGKEAFIISDKPMKELGYIEKIEKLLNKQNVNYTVYTGVDSETKDTHVKETVRKYEEKRFDFIIALGGGSCIDAAKACALVVTNDKELPEFLGLKDIPNKPLPVVAIPTTSGTGSEVTDAMVVTNTETNVKMMIKHPYLMPRIAIVDPELTMSAPQSLSVATGVDALCHAIEAYLSRKSHVYTDTLALSATKAIMANLKAVSVNGNDIEARNAMSIASMQAGTAFSNSSVTLVHGMSRPLGALFNVPHGISNAMLLVPVLEYSLEECTKELAEIGRHLDSEIIKLSELDAAQATIKLIKDLCQSLDIPNLKEWGIDEDTFTGQLEKMAEDALASGSPANNPKVPSKEEVIDLYKKCYSYK